MIFDWFLAWPDGAHKQSRKFDSPRRGTFKRRQRPSSSSQSHDNKAEQVAISGGLHFTFWRASVLHRYLWLHATLIPNAEWSLHPHHFCFAVPGRRERGESQKPLCFLNKQPARSAHGTPPWGLWSLVETQSFPDPWIFNLEYLLHGKWYWYAA